MMNQAAVPFLCMSFLKQCSGRTCGAYGGEERCIQSFGGET